ncbi:hypothetical protein DFH11DRAFT_1604251 [Phellopilus nigrolimitatus]|nr:hypothetical protein DFH11DRAFT_1604251 [Phellopilus nigrolimitatus]
MTPQATQFYSGITQIFGLSNNSALPPDLRETLAQLVKTVGPGIDIPGFAALSSATDLNGGTGAAFPKADHLGMTWSSVLSTSTRSSRTMRRRTRRIPCQYRTNSSPDSGSGSEVDHVLPQANRTSRRRGDH